MRLGLPICALRASGRRTSGKGCSGWQSPKTGDAHATLHHPERRDGGQPNLGWEAQMVSGWPSPMAGTPATETYNEAGNNDSSRKTVALVSGWVSPRANSFKTRPNKLGGITPEEQAQFAGWPTPTGEDVKQDGPKVMNRIATDGMKTTDQRLRNFVQMAGWASPMESDYKNKTFDDRTKNLSNDVLMAGWASPTARDFRSEEATDEYNRERWGHPRGKPLSAETSGLIPAGSGAATGSGGGFRLNPKFSLYLMGFPIEWARCAERVTRSARRLRRSS